MTSIRVQLLYLTPSQDTYQANPFIYSYSPVGNGMLTGTLHSPTDLAAGDHRRIFPKYQEGNFQQNLKLVDALGGLAAEKGCTVSQVALGWLVGLSRRPDMPTIIPIPGSSKLELDL
jgi:pyridoxine 4-dehydrogenase